MSESDTLALQCVGRILKPARLMAGKGMRQFAQEIGLLPSRISEIETGSAPTAAELKLMADALEAARREGIDWRESTVATLAARESELAEANERALKYKNYTHARMDKLGAPHEVPASEHTKAGCRIGGRFDWVEQQLAEAQRRVDSIANAQYNACTTECIDGIWWAKGSGIVAGPQATEQDVLLEVAENWWRVAAAAQRRVAELEGDAERYRYIRDTLAQMLNPKMSGQHTWRVTTIHATGGTFEEVLDKHMAERPIKADRITPTEPEK